MTDGERTGYGVISVRDYREKAEAVFRGLGFSPEESRTITDVLLAADLFGVESHGISRIMKYVKLVREGIVDRKAEAVILKETPVSALLDARSAMGQLVSEKAMGLAIEKARTSGIGMVQVRRSNHFGIAGYYALKAAEQGLIGVTMTNTQAIMVPTFSAEALLGSNPIAVAFPAGEQPFLFDAATTVVTRGKLELYDKLGKELPCDWAVSHTGKVSRSPGEVLRDIREKRGGGILPAGGAGEEMAGYKGYGFAMICELMTSVLSGGIPAMHKQDKGDTSHAFYAVDPELFGDAGEIREAAQRLIDEIHAARPAEGEERILVAGEKEFRRRAERMESGIPLSLKVLNELDALLAETAGKERP
ncbi:MAG: Ldh family oxidoreductase [Clostridia bacterium]|nr:Ldh family oxidoreductase [Clostridia bacterium]